MTRSVSRRAAVPQRRPGARARAARRAKRCALDAARRCATTSPPTRSRRCRSLTHFDATLGRYPVHRLQGRRRAADRRAMRCAPPASRWWWPASATARAARASTARRPRRSAGMRLVIAESFERIYRQNADNIGLFTSHRLRPGRAHRSAARRSRSTSCSPGRDALAAAILRSGGLLRLRPGAAARRARRPPAPADAAPPRTLFEKIVARHALATPDTPARPQPGEGALRARRLALHPRVLHRHVRAPADAHLRRRAGAARAATASSRSRTTLSYVHAEPGARGAAAWWRTCAAMSRAHRAIRRAPRPAHAPLPARDAEAAATTAATARRASRTR